jgi:hypothetical protein
MMQALMGPKVKTEHAGAKNGGGSYGKREDVKRESRRMRRARDREEVTQQLPTDAPELKEGRDGPTSERVSSEREPE